MCSSDLCIVIFINQLREKVGVMYGNPEVTTGGRALKFYSSVRIDIRRVESLKNGSEVVGNHVRAKIVKNKVAPPFRQAEFDIMFGEGIAKEGELVDMGVELGLVQKSGSWFSMGETRIGQGRDAARQYLKENPEIAEQLEEDIRGGMAKRQAEASAKLGRAAVTGTEPSIVPPPAAPRAPPRSVDVSADDFEDE